MVLHTKHKETVPEKVAKLPGIRWFSGASSSFPVTVWIHESYGGGGKWRTDRAARMTYEDYEVYELKSDGTELEAPDYEHLSMDPDGNPLLMLYSPEKGAYHPMSMAPRIAEKAEEALDDLIEEGEIDTDHEDYKKLREHVDALHYSWSPRIANYAEWLRSRLRKNHEMTKEDSTPWYATPQAQMVATGIFIFLTMLGFTYYWQNGLSEITGMTDALVQSAKSSANSVK